MKTRESGFGCDFNVDERVEFDFLGDGVVRKGTVLGLAWDHIIRMYIVLLDQPFPTHKAITVPNTSMWAEGSSREDMVAMSKYHCGKS